MNAIGFPDVTAHPSELVDRVGAGHTIEITRCGNPAARRRVAIIPRNPVDKALPRSLTASMTRQTEIAADLVRWMRNGGHFRRSVSAHGGSAPRFPAKWRSRPSRAGWRGRNRSTPDQRECINETSSAMVFKVRAGQITVEECTAELETSNKLVAARFTVLAVIGGRFQGVAKFADLHTLGVRADDAVHLATASEHGTTVFILDERLAAASPAVCVPTRLLA